MYAYHKSLIFSEHTYTANTSAYKMAHVACCQLVRCTHTYTKPCLQDHTWLVANQGDAHTHTPNPSYKTTHVAGRRSGRCTHTYTKPCLQDRTYGWLLVSQGDVNIHVYTKPCLQARTCGWSPVRETYTKLPKSPHTSVRKTYIHTQSPAYKTAYAWIPCFMYVHLMLRKSYLTCTLGGVENFRLRLASEAQHFPGEQVRLVSAESSGVSGGVTGQLWL